MTVTAQECFELYWRNPGWNIPQSNFCTATYLPSFENIQIRRTGHAGHCWRSKDEHISDVLLWTPSHGQANLGRPDRTYYLCMDTELSLEDLPEVMDNRDVWQERVREIRASRTTWWWWWWWWYIKNCQWILLFTSHWVQVKMKAVFTKYLPIFILNNYSP